MSDSLSLINFRLLSVKEVCLIFGIASYALDSYIQAGIIPEPYMLGKHNFRWRSDEIEETIEMMFSQSQYKEYGLDIDEESDETREAL